MQRGLAESDAMVFEAWLHGDAGALFNVLTTNVIAVCDGGVTAFEAELDVEVLSDAVSALGLSKCAVRPLQGVSSTRAMREAMLIVWVIGALGARASDASAQRAQETTAVGTPQRAQTSHTESAGISRVVVRESLGGPVAVGTRVVATPTVGLVVAGALTFGAAWVPSVIASALTMPAPNSQLAATLMIPAAGPFVWAAIGGRMHSLSAPTLAVLVFDGVLQSFGVGLFIAGLALPRVALNTQTTSPRVGEVPSPLRDNIRRAGIALTVLGGVAVGVGGALLVTEMFASSTRCFFSFTPLCGSNNPLLVPGAIVSGVGLGAMLVPGIALLIAGYSPHASTSTLAPSTVRRASGQVSIPSVSLAPSPGALRLEVAGEF